MTYVLDLLSWPFAMVWRTFCLLVSRVTGRPCDLFSPELRRLMLSADVVEVHHAAFKLDREDEPANSKGLQSWPLGLEAQSLGMVRLESGRDRRRVARSLISANTPLPLRSLCMGVEYVVRFEGPQAWAEIALCFDCMDVWVFSSVGNSKHQIVSFPRPLLERLLRRAGVPAPARLANH